MENNTEITCNTENTKKGIPGSTLKLIAITVMLIDHIAAVVMDHYIMNHFNNGIYDYYNVYRVDMIMRLIGRLGFPIFCFLLVEGFTHTHSKWKYARNLAIFALISEIPFNLAIDARLISLDYQNVFFTLLLGLLGLIGIKASMDRDSWTNVLKILSFPAYFLAGMVTLYFVSKWLMPYGVRPMEIISDIPMFLIAGVISVVFLLIAFRGKTIDEKASIGMALYSAIACVIAAELLKTDYAGSGVIVILAMYAVRKYGYVKQGLIGCIILTIMQAIEFSCFLILIPLKHYNGERGISLKYFFYAFYPVHLTILYLICVLMKTV